MDFAKKVIEYRNVVKEVTEEEKKKRTLVSSIQEDFQHLEKSVDVVQGVVNQEPTALMKLFGSAFPADEELEKLAAQVLEATSTIAKATNPLAPALLLQKIEEFERKGQKTNDDSPSILQDSALLMNIHYKAHVASIEQKRQVVPNENEDWYRMEAENDMREEQKREQHKRDIEQESNEQVEKNKQDSKKRHFEKASPEEKQKLLEKDLKEAEDQNSGMKRLQRLLDSMGSIFMPDSGGNGIMSLTQAMNTMKEFRDPSRKHENQLRNQLRDIEDGKKLEEKAKKMKKIMKSLTEFPTKIKIPHSYLLSASEEYSKEKEPFKSHLHEMAMEKQQSCPPKEFEKALKKELEKFNEALTSVQTESVKNALLKPFGVEFYQLPRYEQNHVNHYATRFIWEAYEKQMKTTPEFLQREILLPKSVRNFAFAKFKGEMLQLVDEIERDVSKLFVSLKCIL